jgi:hypothetical protein
MGFLRSKTIKGNEYFYWCNRIRSQKRYGGTGKVKSPDLLLGRSVIGKYLPYYLHMKEIPLREYAEATIAYLLEKQWSFSYNGEPFSISKAVEVGIDWQAKPIPCVYLKSSDKRIDCRRKNWRQIKLQLQDHLSDIHQRSTWLQQGIESVAYCLGKHLFYDGEAQKARDRLKEYLKNPDKVWTEWSSVRDEVTGEWLQQEISYRWHKNADSVLDEKITASERTAAQEWEQYQKFLRLVVNSAPPSQRTKLEAYVIQRVERLVKLPHWLERYEENVY